MVKFNINSIDPRKLLDQLMTLDEWDKIPFLKVEHKTPEARQQFIDIAEFVPIRIPKKIPIVEISYWDNSKIFSGHQVSWYGHYDFNTKDIIVTEHKFSING